MIMKKFEALEQLEQGKRQKHQEEQEQVQSQSWEGDEQASVLVYTTSQYSRGQCCAGTQAEAADSKGKGKAKDDDDEPAALALTEEELNELFKQTSTFTQQSALAKREQSLYGDEEVWRSAPHFKPPRPPPYMDTTPNNITSVALLFIDHCINRVQESYMEFLDLEGEDGDDYYDEAGFWDDDDPGFGEPGRKRKRGGAGGGGGKAKAAYVPSQFPSAGGSYTRVRRKTELT